MIWYINTKGLLIKGLINLINQYPVASPFNSMTLGTTLSRWRMYFLHLIKSTVAQNCKIPLTSSSFVFGFTSRLINSFSSCQRFSMEFRSGDSGGVRHQLTPWSSMNFTPCYEQCFGSLACIKRWPAGNTSLINGNKVLSRICTNSGAFSLPSNMHTAVGPRMLIPAHMCTFSGCLGLGLFPGGSPLFLQQNRRWDSACMEHSLVKITLLKFSPRICRAKVSLFSLFTPRISWQYELPLNVHPREILQRRTVQREIV